MVMDLKLLPQVGQDGTAFSKSLSKSFQYFKRLILGHESSSCENNNEGNPAQDS